MEQLERTRAQSAESSKVFPFLGADLALNGLLPHELLQPIGVHFENGPREVHHFFTGHIAEERVRIFDVYSVENQSGVQVVARPITPVLPSHLDSKPLTGRPLASLGRVHRAHVLCPATDVARAWCDTHQITRFITHHPGNRLRLQGQDWIKPEHLGAASPWALDASLHDQNVKPEAVDGDPLGAEIRHEIDGLCQNIKKVDCGYNYLTIVFEGYNNPCLRLFDCMNKENLITGHMPGTVYFLMRDERAPFFFDAFLEHAGSKIKDPLKFNRMYDILYTLDLDVEAYLKIFFMTGQTSKPHIRTWNKIMIALFD